MAYILTSCSRVHKYKSSVLWDMTMLKIVLVQIDVNTPKIYLVNTYVINMGSARTPDRNYSPADLPADSIQWFGLLFPSYPRLFSETLSAISDSQKLSVY